MDLFCNYCEVEVSHEKLKEHWNTVKHQVACVPDDERPWKYRCLPIDFQEDQEFICERFMSAGKCIGSCKRAHGEGQFKESKMRLNYRKQKLATDKCSVESYKSLFQARQESPCATETFSGNSSHEFAYDDELYSSYPIPTSPKLISQDIFGTNLNESNYYYRQHQLLYIEEMVQRNLLSKYRRSTRLHLTNVINESDPTCRAKRAPCGELFARVSLLPWVLRENVEECNLLLNNSNVVIVVPEETIHEEKRKVYESFIEQKEKHDVYLRLSRTLVRDLQLNPRKIFKGEVHFQLERLPFCEMHRALDELQNTSLLFPDVGILPCLRFQTNKTSYSVYRELSRQQRRAVMTITAALSIKLPPILIAGPFGTGKTFTLFQATKVLLQDPSNRLLLCTQSISAADVYMTKYFNPYVAEGHLDATPFGLYHSSQRVGNVHPNVQNSHQMKMIVLQDIMKHRIVVTTLRTAKDLRKMGIEKGYFTHIMIDDSVQATECETLFALCLATENTRIVLAGDFMQIAPKVYSAFARESNFDKSLLERLWDLYPEFFPCKFHFTNNDCSHKEIVDFISKEFYGTGLSSGDIKPQHGDYYGLKYFPVEGEEEQDSRSTGIFNNAEADMIVKRIVELKRSWPGKWGEQDHNSIAVLTPYSAQVLRIRAALAERNVHNIFVGKVTDVQGRYFQAVFLSTIHSYGARCSVLHASLSSHSGLDYGYLSDMRLMYAALTRAQFLVAVVGNAEALCSIGSCRNVWKNFVSICQQNNIVCKTELKSSRALRQHETVERFHSEVPSAKSLPEQVSHERIITPDAVPSIFANAFSEEGRSLLASVLINAYVVKIVIFVIFLTASFTREIFKLL